MPTEGSDAGAPLVIELVGPLMDDGGGFARTIQTVLADAGVELRPGALEQVAGASAGWALATLLEGHGHEGDAPRIAALEEALVRRWAELVGSGGVRWRPEAVAAAARAAVHRPLAILTGLPAPVAESLLQGSGLDAAGYRLLAADGSGGIPRPDALASWLKDAAAVGTPATALLSSAPALLAAIGARCVEVVLIGEAGPIAAMLAERHAPSVSAALDG